MCVLSCLSSGHSPNAITITTGSRCHPELLLVRSPWEKGLILSPRRRERPAWARAARVPEGSEPAGVAGSLGRCVGKGSARVFVLDAVPGRAPWPPARRTAALGLGELQAAAEISHALARHSHSPL